MNNPIISVIIPTYNRAHLLPRSIESVLNQTYKDFELIIVDDGSNDNTDEVVNKYIKKDNRIKYIKFEKNKGGNVARNAGINHSRGEYIAFLDSDDEWLSKKLERQISVFHKSKIENLGLVYCGSYAIKEKKIQKIFPYRKGEVFEDLLKTNIIIGGGSGVIIKKTCFENCGKFDENIILRYGGSQEYEMWIRIAKKYNFDFTLDHLIKYYIHKISITGGSKFIEKKKAREYIFNKYKEYYLNNPKLYSTALRYNGTRFVRENFCQEGRRNFIKSIKINPLNWKSYLYLFFSIFGSNFYNKLLKIKANILNIKKYLIKK
jgi:glycosyltransferase involved in cell wall biosynthesis